MSGHRPRDEHRKIGREEVTHVGDDAGAFRHPGEGAGVGEHHKDGGEGEEDEDSGVPGLIPVGLRRRRAYPAAAARRRAKNESGETWKNPADPARTGSMKAP